ncbi:MAG: DMT family transporter [Rhodovarius sp.]|nr:DMT family transporter [Rhodovarius sp.]MDW8314456.1 DMT family transporter [Rhodovarius sp.]
MRGQALGAVLVFGTALSWGSNWPMLKLLLEELPPMTARGVAGVAAGVMLAALAWPAGQRLAVAWALWPRLALAALLNVMAWMGFATIGLLWLGAAEAAILAYTAPVWTALLAWPVLGEVPTPRRAAALVLALAGVLVLFGGRGIALGLEKLPGMGLLLAAGFLFALGTVLAKRRPLPLPPLAAAAWQVGLGCAPLLVFGLLSEPQPWRDLSAAGWFFLVWMAVVPLGLAYLMWFEALKRVSATLAGIGTMLAPMVGVAGAAMFLGEAFGWREGAALLCILAGVALAMRG